MNIEEAVIGHLEDVLGVPVQAQATDPRPEVFATVERTGGATTHIMDEATLAVQWWADSVQAASDLCSEGTAALLAMPVSDEFPDVCHVDADTSPRYIDPESGQARYQTTCRIVAAIREDEEE